LGHFHAQEATEDGIRAIVRSINAASKPPLDDARLDTAFEKWWPDLAAKLLAIDEAAPTPAGDGRNERELLEETLDIVRSLARTLSEPPLWADYFRSGRWRPAEGVQRIVYATPETVDKATWDVLARLRDAGSTEMPSEVSHDEGEQGRRS
jgi:hypothetical protein